MPKKPPSLAVVRSEPLSDLMVPPPDLGDTGRHLWSSIQAQYRIHDSGGLAMLKLACESADRAQACRERIDHDGLMLRTKSGLKEHPLLKAELGARSFTVRTLQRLGLDVEAIGSPGRQSGR